MISPRQQINRNQLQASMVRSAYIINGCVGSGKTTLANINRKNIPNIVMIQEDVSRWIIPCHNGFDYSTDDVTKRIDPSTRLNLLEDFIEKTKDYENDKTIANWYKLVSSSSTFQIYASLTRYLEFANRLLEDKTSDFLMDMFLVDDYFVYNVNYNENEFHINNTVRDIFDNMIDHIIRLLTSSFDRVVVINLDLSNEDLVRRIATRNRPGEIEFYTDDRLNRLRKYQQMAIEKYKEYDITICNDFQGLLSEDAEALISNGFLSKI